MAGEKKKNSKKEKHREELEFEEVSFDDSEEGVEFDSEAAVEDLLSKIEKLKKKLVASEREKQEYLDGWQRARSEFAKFKKNSEDVKEEITHRSKRSVVEDFLPVVDSFSMAFSNKEAWKKVDENWRMGVEYIHSQLFAALEREGVKEISAEGEMFDPSRHEPLETVAVDDESQDHMVVEVVQKGYEMKGEVIRPAKVKVGKFQG